MRLAALAALIISGCASLENTAPPVTPAMVSASGGASPATLEDGRRIFTGACTACHSAKPAARYSESEWHRIVGEMAARTKLDASRQSILLAYLTAARAVPPVH